MKLSQGADKDLWAFSIASYQEVKTGTVDR